MIVVKGHEFGKTRIINLPENNCKAGGIITYWSLSDYLERSEEGLSVILLYDTPGQALL